MIGSLARTGASWIAKQSGKYIGGAAAATNKAAFTAVAAPFAAVGIPIMKGGGAAIKAGYTGVVKGGKAYSGLLKSQYTGAPAKAVEKEFGKKVAAAAAHGAKGGRSNLGPLRGNVAKSMDKRYAQRRNKILGTAGLAAGGGYMMTSAMGGVNQKMRERDTSSMGLTQSLYHLHR